MRERLKELSAGVAIYGAGDAAIQIVNFGLMAVYVKGGFLTSLDYGALAAIGAIEAFARVASRLGLDGAFMRYYHERGDDLPRLASTIVWFLLASNAVIFGALFAGSSWLGAKLFDEAGYVGALRLMLANTFVMALTFVPFHTMRMRQQAATYSAFTFGRSVATLVLRIVFVIGLGYGLAGVYAADLAVTLALVPLLWPWFRPWIRPLFSTADLRTVLRFGLPRVPHGLAQQAIDGGNKLLFGRYITQSELGVYQNAVTLGTAVKFFTSAFETAWAPFYYSTARQPDGRTIVARTATYGFAVLVLLAAGTVAVARDVVLVMLTPAYLAAAPVLPIVAVGIACQGAYLLTSIGLNLSGRTEFYPVATFAAAVTTFGAGVWLMPAYGAVGAALAFALSYVVQVGVALWFARRFFPIPYELGRVVRLVAAGVAAAAVALTVVPPMPPLAGLFVRGLTVVAVYAACLLLTGFLRPTERAALREWTARLPWIGGPHGTRGRLNRRVLTWAALVSVVLAMGALLRIIGIGYGLPAVYNPDEVAIMNRALGLSQTGFNPQNFLYPSLYFYVLFAWEGAWFLLGSASGVYGSLKAFETSFFVDPSAIYVAGRLLTALCGVATIAATFELGRVLFGRLAGLAAGVILAVAPLAVRDAHYVKHDVPVTLLIVLAHLVLARDLVSVNARRRTAWAGLLAGLAMSTHYYAVFLALPLGLIALHPRSPGERLPPRLGRLAVGALTCVAGFFAASPFLLAEPMTAIRDVVANREIVIDRATVATGAFGSLHFYVDWLLRDAAGLTAGALAAIGLVAATASDWRRSGFLLLFPASFLLFISNTYPASRYLNPIVPFMAVLAGAAIAWLGARPSRVLRATALGLLAAAAIEGAWMSLGIDRFFTEADTRTVAREWIETHIPPGASILLQPYSVPLRMSRDALEEALATHLGSADKASIKFRRQLELAPYPMPAYRTIYLGDGGLDADKIYVSPAAFTPAGGLAPLRALSVTWVAIKRYNVDDPAMSALNEALERGGRLAARFSPYAAATDEADRRRVPPFLHNTDTWIRPELERPGPIIEVWKID